MDFNSLIHVAQKNEKTTNNGIRYYSTKFEPPKKESKKSVELSANIKKFLARKEHEEKQKVLKAQVRKDELLALRSQDKKATRRVSVMLKRTKSANKSVIEDAIDKDNTAVTLAGPSQPDEDDYGYVSQEASAFYNKMMEKYNSMPEEPKIFASAKKNTNSNLSSTKDRVRAALLREQEEAMLPHRRKRKSKHEIEDRNTSVSPEPPQEEKSQEKCKSKPRSSAPPPMNFQELLKIAEKKQFEPILIEPKKKPEDEEHPMTKKQKREFEKEKAWREQREQRRLAQERGENTKQQDTKMMPPPNKIPKLSNSDSKPLKTNPEKIKASYSSQRPIENSIKKTNSERNPDRRPSENIKIDQKPSKLRAELEKGRSSSSSSSSNNSSFNSSSSSSSSANQIRATNSNPNRNNLSSNSNTRMPSISKSNEIRNGSLNSNKYMDKSRASMSNISISSSKYPDKSRIPDKTSSKPSSSSDIRSKSSMDQRSRLPDVKKRFPPGPEQRSKYLDGKPKQFSPSDMRPKQFPPSDVRPKQFSPSDARPKQFPPTDVRRKPISGKKLPMGHKRRILDDDDSEYDSEMDDFIDDGQEEEEDYSRHIKDIFGYDKSKYRYADEDENDTMESSFSQMMREEFISGKIGLMEDLEDIKQEAFEKKRKAMMKKKMMMRQ